MRTTIKAFAIAVVAMICSTVEVSAQKIAAAAIVDQHNASETANYKLMMLGLAIIYGVYVMLSMKKKRELSRLMGRSK